MKYLVKARIEVEGIVEKSDVIGAIFGQTEGLFGPQFDLKELQDKGRIGRIYVDLRTQGSRTVGELSIPSNLDRVETALIAAMIESVERVGPYPAKIRVVEIKDMRVEKIKRIVERAKDILRKWSLEKTPDLKEVLYELEEAIKIPEVAEYGPEKLPAGPDIDKVDTVIIVEGRADVINMLRYGHRNVIAIEGAKEKIPKTIIELCKRKKCIAFVDGDHGGELVLKELLRTVKLDYIARAPPGKEVEELTGKEIAKALKNMIPVEQYKVLIEKPKPPTVEETKPTPPVVEKVETIVSLPEEVVNEAKKLSGTLEAILYDRNWKVISKVPVRDLYTTLTNMEPNKIYSIIFDGVITQRLIDIAEEKGVKIIIGARVGNIVKRPFNVELLTLSDIT